MNGALKPDWLNWPQTQKLVAAFAPGSLRFVGGAVRDALLAREVTDVDAATTLLPEETMAALEKAGIRAIPTGIKHGTVTALIDGKHFEITTLRRDVATDGRHAEVEYTTDWGQDAARRDFTMNALYLSPSGELFDYHDGIEDAKAGCVRFIGDPHARVAEDYLRVLRFFRFYAGYGEGAPDRESLIACVGAAPHLDTLSGERVRDELLKFLAAENAAAVLHLMQEKYVLPHVLGFDVRDCAMFAALGGMEPTVKLAAFLLKADKGPQAALDIMMSRLRLPGDAAKTLSVIVKNYPFVTETIPLAEQKKWIRALGAKNFSSIVTLHHAQAPATAYSAMLTLADTWQPPQFPVTGDDLIARGIASGKAMGDALRALEEAWEKSDYTMTKEALLKK